MKAGTEYELFVKEVYEMIHRYEGVDHIRIQHDVKLKGASGVKRQVDIYWEFRSAGVNYRVIVECKDYKHAVSLERIDAFHAKLLDLGGATGVFVSKNGFQSGAIELAKQYGIQLREIRLPNDRDWEGYLRDIEIELHLLSLRNLRPQLIVDQAWAAENHYRAKNFCCAPDETFLEDQAEGVSVSVGTLLNRLKREKAGVGFQQTFSYNNASIRIGEKSIKIKGITFTYDVTETRETIRISGDHFIKAIVRDVIAGETSSLRVDGSVIRKESPLSV